MFIYKCLNEILSIVGEFFLVEGFINEILDVYMIY